MYIATGNGLSSNVGGSMIRSIEIARRLSKLGCSIHFLTTIGGYKACLSEGLDVVYHILPASFFRHREKTLLDRVTAYFISTLASFWIVATLPNCSIVYSDSDYFCDIIPAILYKRINGAKWVAMTHHQIKINKKRFKDFLISLLSSRAQIFSYYLFKRFADRIFVYKSFMGSYIAGYMVHNGFPALKIDMVSNGVDLEFIETITEEKKIYGACFVGGLRPNKGIFDIAPIWKTVVKNKKDATLIIVGKGLKTYEDELRKQIKSYGLESHIKMVGAKKHRETIKIIKRSKIFISPSYEEGWGIAICEALSCGIPVVAYDLRTYDIFEDCVLRVPTGDIYKFAETVEKIFTDKHLRKNLRDLGKKISKEFDWNKIAERELELFKKVKALNRKNINHHPHGPAREPHPMGLQDGGQTTCKPDTGRDTEITPLKYRKT